MKVLMAVEDSSFGAAMCDFVVNHRWPAGTMVRVLHVQSWVPPEHDLLRSKGLMEYLEGEYAFARSLVNAMKERLQGALPDLAVEDEIMEGSAARRILATAGAWGADVIVMGSHGRSGMSQFFIGSVSQAVAAHAPCSLVIVRLREGD